MKKSSKIIFSIILHNLVYCYLSTKLKHSQKYCINFNFKGVFDLDYTSFHERRREKRESKGTKHKKKVIQNQPIQSESVSTQEVDLEEVKGKQVLSDSWCTPWLSSVHW